MLTFLLENLHGNIQTILFAVLHGFWIIWIHESLITRETFFFFLLQCLSFGISLQFMTLQLYRDSLMLGLTMHFQLDLIEFVLTRPLIHTTGCSIVPLAVCLGLLGCQKVNLWHILKYFVFSYGFWTASLSLLKKSNPTGWFYHHCDTVWYEVLDILHI